MIINTADEDFTLTGSESGQQYLICYRIVSKVGVSEASDTIPSSVMVPKTRSEFLQYSRQLTLDLNTANKHLRLSEENRVITGNFTELQSYPDHPDRFDCYEQVLCSESVSEQRSYWEIEWRGGVSISVSYQSIGRKGYGDKCGFGFNDQSWSLDCTPSGYSFIHNNKETKLPAVASRRVGVYVDHSAGTLAFYSVIRDTMSLIHTVKTTFTQPLYPGFYVFLGSSVKLC